MNIYQFVLKLNINRNDLYYELVIRKHRKKIINKKCIGSKDYYNRNRVNETFSVKIVINFVRKIINSFLAFK